MFEVILNRPEIEIQQIFMKTL